jgi:para-nitrobenzyl esterase
MMSRLLAAMLCASLVACAEPPDAGAGRPEVSIDGERLIGEYLAGADVAVFRGIPFAEPPVGELRWRAPQPLRTKVAMRDVAEFAPACMQSMRILEWYRDMAEIFGSTRDEFDDLAISEDCLYLNVWTTNQDENAKLPVMVYVHGGSNNSGWAYEPDYHGHVLAERGVVVVSIAYRLGLFGFLSHPDIGNDEAQANFGLWDQVAALQWIQENIHLFGGDPDQITLFGESAGSQDILALMASPKAKGLFHRAILQSNAGFGLPPRTRTLDGERQRGEETTKLFGFDGDGAWQKLKSIAADELLARYEEHFPRYYHAPAVDGQLLQSPIWDTITAGQLADIPFIIGSNGDERYGGAPEDATEETVRKTIKETVYLDSPRSFAAVQSETDYREMIDRISTADGMLCPSQYTAALYGDAWVYYFARVREGDGGAAVRAYHGAELPYTFGTHPGWMTTTDVDRKLTDQILSYWTQFAATGNPNSPGLPEWPAFTGPAGAVMEFADEARAGAAQEPVLCRIFSESVKAPN